MGKIRLRLTFKVLIIALLLWSGCDKDEQNSLMVTPSVIEFEADGGNVVVNIQTDAGSWQIDNPASDWLALSSTSGDKSNAYVAMNVVTKTPVRRVDTLTITAGDAIPVTVIVSQEASTYVYDLSANDTVFSFPRAGSSSTLSIVTTAASWSLNSDVDWLEFSSSTGTKGTTKITITALENEGTESRSTTLTLCAEYAPTISIEVSQTGEIYPSYNTDPIDADTTGVSATAAELAKKMIVGWNIGNTLEAIGGETSWGNPKVTQALITLIKESGFNTVRIPCSWYQYMDNSTTAELKSSWLARVKEVVQYCVNEDMYVILNIHWDSGWLENNCTTAKQEQNNAMQKAFWEQIATYMRDFDQHLLFASANEPNVSNATEMAVLKSYHQTFIDAVRSTGGKNANRVLVIQGPGTDIETTNKLMTTLPTDEVDDKLMAEIHYYSPYQFCLMTEDADWGNMFYYWGEDYHSDTDTDRNSTWGEEDYVDEMFALMKTQFVNKGIPVILGEYAASRRSSLTGESLTLHLASRAYYTKYITQQAIANGMIPYYWDNGGLGDNASGIFNRSSNTVFDQQVLNAIMEGAAK